MNELKEGDRVPVPWLLRQRVGLHALVRGDWSFAWACLSGKNMTMTIEKVEIMRRAVPVRKPHNVRYFCMAVCLVGIHVMAMWFAFGHWGHWGWFVVAAGWYLAYNLPKGMW